MRIGILCHPTCGGSGVVASECALSLAQRGHRVHLFAPGVPPRLAEDAGSVVLHHVHGIDYPLFSAPHEELAATGAILDVIEREGLDVLHAHYALPHAVSAMLAREASRSAGHDPVPRLVITMHGTDVTLVAAAPAYAPLLRHVLGQADAVTAVSRDLADRLRSWWGREARAIETLHNFVDSQTFAPSAARAPGPLRAIHVSNFRPLKQVALAISNFERAARGTGAQLTLVGDGPDLPHCQELAIQLGAQDSIRFLGERRDLPTLLAAADAFLLTSREESFGLSALEAAACGLAVLAPRVGGLPEVVEDGLTGCLVDAEDPDAYVRVLAQWIADPGVAIRLGRAGRERAATHFDREAGVDRYEALYQRLISP